RTFTVTYLSLSRRLTSSKCEYAAGVHPTITSLMHDRCKSPPTLPSQLCDVYLASNTSLDLHRLGQIPHFHPHHLIS
ncbi:hypothetical protein JMJ77_0014512, partial [Colletotrichum scovillei]